MKILNVKAKWNVAYKGKPHNGGDVFEMLESHYPDYKNDVIIIDETPVKPEKEVTQDEIKNKITGDNKPEPTTEDDENQPQDNEESEPEKEVIQDEEKEEDESKEVNTEKTIADKIKNKKKKKNK